MKILFVTNEIPYPPNNGVRIPAFHAMRLMREAGHDIALATLTLESDEINSRFKVMEEMCAPGMAFMMHLPSKKYIHIQLAMLLFNRLFFVERYRLNHFEKSLIKLVESFQPDVIHFDQITMAQYRSSISPNVSTIASVNDSYALTLKNSIDAGLYQGSEILYRTHQYRQTQKYESKTYPKFSSVHLMSKVDADYLETLNPNIHCTVVSNGVDSSLFEAAPYSQGKKDVIFVAKLVGENLVNLENFLLNAWPNIHLKCPSIKFFIVGEIGTEAQEFKTRFHEKQNIFFKGYASNLTDAYKETGIAVVPINKNCGIINKAIEAMAAGHAVVGFEKTFAGIAEAKPGTHCATATSFAEMSKRIIELVENDHNRCAIQRAAHELAREHYSWASRKQLYEDMYRNALSPDNRTL